jgi:hypothetical protein
MSTPPLGHSSTVQPSRLASQSSRSTVEPLAFRSPEPFVDGRTVDFSLLAVVGRRLNRRGLLARGEKVTVEPWTPDSGLTKGDGRTVDV